MEWHRAIPHTGVRHGVLQEMIHYSAVGVTQQDPIPRHAGVLARINLSCRHNSLYGWKPIYPSLPELTFDFTDIWSWSITRKSHKCTSFNKTYLSFVLTHKSNFIPVYFSMSSRTDPSLSVNHRVYCIKASDILFPAMFLLSLSHSKFSRPPHKVVLV